MADNNRRQGGGHVGENQEFLLIHILSLVPTVFCLYIFYGG